MRVRLSPSALCDLQNSAPFYSMPDFLTVFPEDDELSLLIPNLIRSNRGHVLRVGQIEHAYQLLQLPVIRYDFVISAVFGESWIGLAQLANEQFTPFVLVGEPNETTLRYAQMLDIDFLSRDENNFKDKFLELFFPTPGRQERR